MHKLLVILLTDIKLFCVTVSIISTLSCDMDVDIVL